MTPSQSVPPLPAADRLVALGRILRPHGVKGEARVQLLTDFPERFLDTEGVFLVSPQGAVRAARICGARFHQDRILLRFEGVHAPEEVALLREHLVSVQEEDLVELEDDEYWHFELEGLEVRLEDGTPLGRLQEVLTTPAHDLYSVSTAGGELLIPAVGEYVKRVDLEGGFMTVVPPVIEA